jgi:hypothetical protein
MPNIVVGCKLPHGLHMELNGVRVTLNGGNSSEIVGTDGVKTGITVVDKDFFDQWAAIHKDAPYLKGGLIFANEKPANVKAEAADKEDLKTGFEGINPDAPAPGVTKSDGDE